MFTGFYLTLLHKYQCHTLLIRPRTSLNLATQFDFATVAKMRFKVCVYFIYVLLEFNFVKKLQENSQVKLLRTLNIL